MFQALYVVRTGRAERLQCPPQANPPPELYKPKIKADYGLIGLLPLEVSRERVLAARIIRKYDEF